MNTYEASTLSFDAGFVEVVIKGAQFNSYKKKPLA